MFLHSNLSRQGSYLCELLILSLLTKSIIRISRFGVSWQGSAAWLGRSEHKSPKLGAAATQALAFLAGWLLIVCSSFASPDWYSWLRLALR